MKPKVVLLQEQVPSYRVPFFRSLADELASRDLDLSVLSSSILPTSDELGFRHQRIPTSRGGRSALGTIYRERPAALVLPHSARFAPLAGITRVLQSQGRKQLLWGGGLARRYGVAPANPGHTGAETRRYGDASSRDRRPVAEAIRRSMLSACDHYLSYTEASTANILDGGYDTARITTLNNAVEPLATPEQLTAARRTPFQLLFVASLVPDKEPLTAVSIVDKLRRLTLGATLRIVGDGPLRNQCEQAASSRAWVHYHGAQHGQALRELALTSDVALIPGRVGLAVLEMASAGLPVATLSTAYHGTEIVYLRDSVNGIFLDSNIDVAARDLQTLLTCRPALERMRSEALVTASKYTIRNMAVNFADGVATTVQRPLPQPHCA